MTGAERQKKFRKNHPEIALENKRKYNKNIQKKKKE